MCEINRGLYYYEQRWGLATQPELRFLKQIMGNTPSISSLVGKELRARHVEDLPPVVPGRCILRAIRLNQVRPYFLLLAEHPREPVLYVIAQLRCATPLPASNHFWNRTWTTYLACFGIVLAVDPPLRLYLQIPLEEQQEVCAGHGASSEEVCGHPAIFKIVWCRPVREDVNEELASGFESARNLGHE